MFDERRRIVVAAADVVVVIVVFRFSTCKTSGKREDGFEGREDVIEIIEKEK